MFRSSILIALTAIGLSACDLRETLMPRLVAGQEAYLGPERFQGSELSQLGPNVFSFRWLHYRNLILDTDEGWVIIDPLNRQAAEELKIELNKRKPDQQVAALIYSHYHLDHASGGAALNPQQVYAHKNAPQYWADFPNAKIAAPTNLIAGDTVLSFGDTDLHLLDLGNSHSDTLFAFLLPRERLLFSVDMGLAKGFLPMGHPDSYGPGVIRALEKLAALDFDRFLPAHFDMGTKDDLLEYLEFQKDVRRLSREALDLYGPSEGATLPGDGEALKKMFVHVYEPLKQKYGHWHGFNQQSLYIVFSNIVGETLGF